jgi:NDP-sugar pyrophosphorylase family protein
MAAARVRTAFVMGAGLGSRLRPLTDSRPKPLVPIFNKPLVTFALDHLLSVGVERFVINTHHLAERWAEFFPERTHRGAAIDFVFEPELLETGGGIANAAARIGWLRDEPFFVYSGDVLTDVDLGKLAASHLAAGNDVTVGLRETGLSTAIACRDGRMVDFRGLHGEVGEYDFANVSVWTRAAVDWLPPASEKAPFFPVLADRLGGGGKIGGVVLEDHEWYNVGTRDEYLRVHRVIAESGWRPTYLAPEDPWPVRVHPTAEVAPDAALEWTAVVGARSRIGAGAELRDCVVWDDAVVAAGARLDRCVVRDFQVASGTRAGEDS